MTRTTRRLALAALAVLSLTGLITGCSADAALAPVRIAPLQTEQAATTPTSADLEAMSPVDLVDTLEAVSVAARATDYRVSVRPDALVVTGDSGDSGERTVPLPGDLFYLSVAPYVGQTHECFFHSLTTCVGELGGENVHVTVTADDGTVLLDEDRTAADNGFVGLWLPRGSSGTLTVATDDGSATTTFGTGADDPTCLTTLQLS